MTATSGLLKLLMFVAVAVQSASASVTVIRGPITSSRPTESQRRCSYGNSISCGIGGRIGCLPYSLICDGVTHCGRDGADEDRDLCAAWKNDCSRGEVKCRRYGHDSCISIHEYCAADSNCEGDLDPRICQMIQDGEVKPLASIILRQHKFADFDKSLHLAKEFVVMLNHTMQHPRCPTMFTLVDDQCLALFFVVSVSWWEARAFCQMLGADLIAFEDITHYTSVVTRLKEAQLTVDFWVGGNLANESDGWRWVDDSAVEMGTPFWAVRYYNAQCFLRNVTFPELNHTREANGGTCYHYLQAPESPPRGHCLALLYEHYYYMSEKNCLQKKSPLCVLTDGDYETN